LPIIFIILTKFVYYIQLEIEKTTGTEGTSSFSAKEES